VKKEATSRPVQAVRAKIWAVAHPSETLVALRAIGGHGKGIAALAPVDVAHEPVDERIRRLEAGGLGDQ
jgi:hypothetical protein